MQTQSTLGVTVSFAIIALLLSRAPLAQLDRVLGYEPRGREFESLRAHHFYPRNRAIPIFLADRFAEFRQRTFLARSCPVGTNFEEPRAVFFF